MLVLGGVDTFLKCAEAVELTAAARLSSAPGGLLDARPMGPGSPLPNK